MNFEYLETERLLLRKLSPDVYHYVFDHYTDEQLMAFFGYTQPAELDKERMRHQKGMITFNRSFLLFQIIKKEDRLNIGWCGFHTWYTEHRRAEIGYALHDERHMGQGIMSETVKPVIGYGFGLMGLNRIEAFVGPGNSPSLSILKKFRFQQEGIMRGHYCKNGIIEDSVILSLLLSDYEQTAD